MSNNKMFHIADILSLITSRGLGKDPMTLAGHILGLESEEAVYVVFLESEEEFKSTLEGQLPWLKNADFVALEYTDWSGEEKQAYCDEFVKMYADKYGETHKVLSTAAWKAQARNLNGPTDTPTPRP